jgi:hypothetical protein
MRRSKVRFLGLVGSVASLAAACNQMLGIEDASVDARLSAAGLAGKPSSPGAGAAGGTGGTNVTTSGGTGAAPTAGSGGTTHQHSGGSGGTEPVGTGGEGAETSTPNSGGSSTQSTGGSHSSSGSGGKATENKGGEGGDEGEQHSDDPCDEYCDEMQSECTGEAEQYRDRAQCMKICHFFPLGKDGDPDANSVACRLKYVKKTEYGLGAEVTAYCRQAGPSGDGKCGTDCEAFCSVMMQVCTEEIAGPNHFASTEDCLATCNGLPAPTVHYSNNDPAVSDGNHALCRLFHVNSAAMADPEEHCEHAMGLTLCEATP